MRRFVQHPKFGKLNVGAQMNQRPGLRWKCPSGQEPKPMQSELRFDFDIGDYDYLGVHKSDIPGNDEVFACVGIAMAVTADVMRHEFGFQHILPVYSGRRGGHLWICDKKACLLTDSARRAIIEFMKPGRKVHESGRKQFKWLLQYPAFGSPDNPMQRDGVFSRIVYKAFRKVGIKPKANGGLGLLDVGFDRKAFLKMIDAKFASDMQTSVCSAATGRDALLIIEQALSCKLMDVRAWLVPQFCEAICTLLWPRADDAVTTHMNHTLKAPFSVHPGTSRVSVPLLGLDEWWDFKPAEGAPLATEPMPAWFADIVQRTNTFIDTLAHSDTELWQPPDLSILEPPPKKRCYELTVGTSDDGTAILSDTKRVAWVVNRQLSVYVDDDGIAHFEMSTHCYDSRPAVVIRPHQYPPFKEDGSLERVLVCMMSALSTATAYSNTAYSIHSWQQIVVVDADVKDELQSIKKANARFERLRERLAEGIAIGEAKVAWGELALGRYFEDQLWPYVDTLRSL